MSTTDIFNNISMITTKALRGVKNNTQMASRVARRWDGDFKGSGKIGNTLNVRLPGFYTTRTGAAINPAGANDSFIPVTMSQLGVDLVMTEEMMTLFADDFYSNYADNMALALWQSIDAGILNTIIPSATSAGINQFAGTVGTAPADLSTFVDSFATMQSQSACPTDGRTSGMFSPRTSAKVWQGLTTLFNPTPTISEQYRNGSIGSAAGIDFFSTANAPSLTLGTWSGTLTVTSTMTTDGTTIAISGMTGAFAVGECLTIQNVYAVNPQGKGVQATLKQFTVVSCSANGAAVVLSPSITLTGPLQNVNSYPQSGAAVYPWGYGSGSALAAGTGQVVDQSLVFHEDAIALCMGDIMDVGSVGGLISKRMKDEQSGLRTRALFWMDGRSGELIFRLDLLTGYNVLRQGFATRNVH